MPSVYRQFRTLEALARAQGLREARTRRRWALVRERFWIMVALLRWYRICMATFYMPGGRFVQMRRGRYPGGSYANPLDMSD